MTRVNWQQVLDADFAVPSDAGLADLTTELTVLLGDPDAHRRDDLALPVLATWIERGVYDDLLAGLGDGMVAGLHADGIGTADPDDAVFRRSFSALVLAECIARDNAQSLLPDSKVLEWADRLITWFLVETDLRGYVPGKGWAHAVAHGADAIGVLAASNHLGAAELTVLLDVVAERVGRPVHQPFTSGEPDRLAAATLAVLRRNEVPFDVVEVWLDNLVTLPAPIDTDQDPYLATGTLDGYVRALYLQLSLAPEPPAARADLLLLLVDKLRVLNPHVLGAPRVSEP